MLELPNNTSTLCRGGDHTAKGDLLNTTLAVSRAVISSKLIIIVVGIIIAVGAPNARAGVIYVDPSATGLNNGSSWADAYTDLQPALLSAVSSDELWVVQGTYYPHPSDITVSIQLKNGVTIYGGFVGTETDVSERGNVWATILSGELGDPGSRFDNSRHVVDGSGTDATAVLDGCAITRGGRAGSLVGGGGVFCDGGSPTLKLVSIYDNEGSFGGGMHCTNNSNPSLETVFFDDNVAQGGGALHNEAGSSPTLYNVFMVGNHVTGSGGGVWNTDGSNPLMTLVVFAGNTAEFQGGGMFCSESSPILTNVVFDGNHAQDSGGAIYLTDVSHPTLINVTVANNTAATGSGGAMSLWLGCDPEIINTIYWGNTAPSGIDEIDDLNNFGSPVFSYSIVNGGLPAGAVDGGNNLYTDPLYRSYNDLRLSPGSPAIDAGNTAANSEPVDAWYRPRVAGAAIDIGAYEFACPTGGPVVYVDDSVFGATEGTSWSDALRYLQDAIDLVDYCGGVNEVWVADGTYRTATEGPDRTLSFELRDGIAIYGGFNGTETSRNERDWKINESILTGEIGAAPVSTDNAYHVVSASGVGSTAVLDGFIVERGYADGGGDDRNGAGILLSNASPTLSNLVVRDNEADLEGGGMAAVGGGSLVLRDVSFENNRAVGGAGVYNSTTDATFTNVVFADNYASDAGGGLANWNASFPDLMNCIFLNNSAVNGGGGLYNYESHPDLVNVSFYGNDGGFIGGGILNLEYSAPILINVIMWGDSASFDGNEIYNDTTLAGPTTTSIVHSLVAGCGGSGGGWNPAVGTDGGNNIDADPVYRNPAIGNLELRFDSPAINVGNNGHNTEPFDIAGNPRYVGLFIDLGAHEYPGPVAVDDTPTLTGTAIQSTYPNPFNPTVSIDFTLQAAGRVELRVFDVRGGLVATLKDENMGAGPQTAQWNGVDDSGRPQASGVYFVRLNSSGQTSVRKILLLK
jgi:predicted outer membrane repeat protein